MIRVVALVVIMIAMLPVTALGFVLCTVTVAFRAGWRIAEEFL